jgi:hypothetical protein
MAFMSLESEGPRPGAGCIPDPVRPLGRLDVASWPRNEETSGEETSSGAAIKAPKIAAKIPGRTIR